MYKEKKKGVWGIILTIILLILIVIFSNSNTENSVLENVGAKIIMPIQNGFTFLKNKITGNETFFADVDKLKEENEKLSNRNKELEKSLKEIESI